MANGDIYLGQGGRVPVHLSNRTGAIPVYESTDVNAVPVFYGTGGGSIPVKVVSRLVGGSMPVRFGAGAVPPPTPPVTDSTYLRPDGVSTYLRPDGTSIYLRP